MGYTEPSALQRRLRGVQVIMVTPFDRNQEVDIEMVRELTNFLIDRGIKEGSGVLVPLGSMSECFSVNLGERRQIVKAVVEEVRKRVPVLVGCNETNTRAVIQLCQDAQDAGADGVMVMPPYYFTCSHEEILEFYNQVSKNIDIGIVLYNNVQVSVDIALNVLHELADIEKIVALKDCTQDCIKFQITAQELSGKLTPLNGGGPLWEPLGTLAGTKGFFTLAGNFAPELALQLWSACEKGEYQKAEMVSRRFTTFIQFMRTARKSIQLTKKIMRNMGLPGGFERPPLLPLTEEEEIQVLEVAKEMGLEY